MKIIEVPSLKAQTALWGRLYLSEAAGTVHAGSA